MAFIDLCAECHLNCQLNFIHSCELRTTIFFVCSLSQWTGNGRLVSGAAAEPEKRDEIKIKQSDFVSHMHFIRVIRPQAI